MTTALVIFGGLAAVGWLSDKLKPTQDWVDMQRRMNAPVAPRPTASVNKQVTPVVIDAKPRIISPLAEQTYEAEWTTLSAS